MLNMHIHECGQQSDAKYATGDEQLSSLSLPLPQHPAPQSATFDAGGLHKSVARAGQLVGVVAITTKSPAFSAYEW